MEVLVKAAKIGPVRKFLFWFPLVKVGDSMKWVILALNIIFPGLGSIIAGFTKWSKTKGKKCVGFGVFEMFTVWIFGLGWYCSVAHGIMIVVRSSGVTTMVKLGLKAKG